jgi:hypothetical protein
VSAPTFQGHQLSEGLPNLVVGDPPIIDVEALENGLIQEPTPLVRELPVQLLWTGQKGEGGLDEVGADLEFFASLLQLGQ